MRTPLDYVGSFMDYYLRSNGFETTDSGLYVSSRDDLEVAVTGNGDARVSIGRRNRTILPEDVSWENGLPVLRRPALAARIIRMLRSGTSGSGWEFMSEDMRDSKGTTDYIIAQTI